ncbi:MAG TPA: hypothetical protein VFE05_15325 [Longimicrobiaceae bacterium]|jgi:hypothetical protein|nr:hypothetical protein [Longimicrobiaceae bacterium]
MRIRSLAATLSLCALASACGHGDGDAAAQGTPAAEAKDVIGKCAIDAADGAPYGRITAEETDASGARMLTIDGGPAVWHKNAANLRVVDCPAGT